jgi:hypothetical protein
VLLILRFRILVATAGPREFPAEYDTSRLAQGWPHIRFRFRAPPRSKAEMPDASTSHFRNIALTSYAMSVS